MNQTFYKTPDSYRSASNMVATTRPAGAKNQSFQIQIQTSEEHFLTYGRCQLRAGPSVDMLRVIVTDSRSSDLSAEPTGISRLDVRALLFL